MKGCRSYFSSRNAGLFIQISTLSGAQQSSSSAYPYYVTYIQPMATLSFSLSHALPSPTNFSQFPGIWFYSSNSSHPSSCGAMQSVSFRFISFAPLPFALTDCPFVSLEITTRAEGKLLCLVRALGWPSGAPKYQAMRHCPVSLWAVQGDSTL